MSRTAANPRPSPLIIGMRRIMRLRVGYGLIGALTLAPATMHAAQWDCRMSADGRGWQCLKDGQPVIDPVVEPAATATPDAVAEPLADTETTPAARRPAEPPAVRPAPTPPPSPARPSVAEMPEAAPVIPVLEPPPAPALAPAPPAPRVAAPPADPAPETVSAPQPPPSSPFEQADDLPDLTGTAAPSAAPQGPADADTRPDVGVSAPDQAAPAVSPATRAVAEQAIETAATSDARIDRGIDWLSCPSGPSSGPRLDRVTTPTSDAPVEISADAAVAELTPEQAMFSGNVRLQQDGVQLEADQIVVDRSANTVDAQGNLLLVGPDIRFAGDSARYSLETRQAQVEQASYRVPPIRARGDAERAAFLGDGISRFTNITYTTCAPGDSAWLLSAESLELDQNEGFGSANNAKLSFLGVPLLYAPRFSFPIDDRRRSGVLVPSVGYSSNTGVDVGVPYYFNLAENYDLTLTPRLMSKRGLMLGGEFRFLTQKTRGALSAEILPDDHARDEGSSTRGALSLVSRTRINPRTRANLDINYVSDSEYLTDLGDSLAATSATHILRRGDLVYAADNWDLLGRLQYYQTIDDTIELSDRPYSQLPMIRLNLEQPEGLYGTTYHLDAEYANFYRRDSVRGHRLALTPALSLPFGAPWWFAEPKVGARYTAYDLTDQVDSLDESPSHATALVSLDAGMYFDRATTLFGTAANQTLEPRLYYLYVPASGQDDQPLFDTTALDFSFGNLFRENRFNGPDRVGDANQVTLALTTRITGQASGEELLRASIGQILYFADRDVTLDGETDDDDSSSAVVGELAALLGKGWRARAGLQWDPHDGDDGTIDQALAQLSYRGADRNVVNAAYRLRDGVVSQTDLAVFWPFSESLSLVGRHYYSLRNSRLLEGLAGVEYGQCCWRLRALVRKYTDDNGDDHNLAFMLQLELNGLGRLGDDIDSTLERGIYGYRTDEND